MKPKTILQFVAAAFILGLMLLPIQAALGQCGGYCQSSSYCPATGYGCGSGLCCYCCETCSYTACDSEYVCTRGYEELYRIIFYQNLWYNCYQGSNCSYSHTSNDQQCNGNCLEPIYC